MKERILEIVDKHSGGVKFTELITELITLMYAADDSAAIMGPDPDPDEVLTVIEDIPELGVLYYAMVLGEGVDRAKWFIYRRRAVAATPDKGEGRETSNPVGGAGRPEPAEAPG